VVRSSYGLCGRKSSGLWTGPADFLADSGCLSLWLEDGVGLVWPRHESSDLPNASLVKPTRHPLAG
jgi:hypothetical protein